MSRLTAAIPAKGSTTDFMMLLVKASLEEAREEHPMPYVDAHHMLGVLGEEVHELRLEIFKKRMNPERVQSKLLQIAAVAVRGIEDVTLPKELKSKS
jgi:hypothetical protein